jgi:hypothetical protein
VLRIPAELENVPLRNPEVFEQLPRRMGSAGRLFARPFHWKSGYGRIEVRVSAAAFEYFDQLLP